MAKAIPELGLCVFLENPGQDGNFCTWPDCVSLLFDYDFVGRSRFRSKVAGCNRRRAERLGPVRVDDGLRL